MNKNKEELLNKLKHLEEDFNTQVTDIKKQIEECDKKAFEPKLGEEYYSISINGKICTYDFYEDNVDKEIIGFGNYFKTKEEAERKCFEIRLHRQSELFALENNETEIDWNDDSEKYIINYNKNNGIFIDRVYTLKVFGQVYFTSKEIVWVTSDLNIKFLDSSILFSSLECIQTFFVLKDNFLQITQ